MNGTLSAWVDGRAACESVGEPPADDKEVIRIDVEVSRTVSVYDLAIQRGDGIFEATSVWRGVPLSLQPHLVRLQNSAALLDLPKLRLDVLRRAADAAIARYRQLYAPGDDEEQLLKILVSRGSDPQLLGGQLQAPGIPHIWILIDPRQNLQPQPAPMRLVKLAKGVSVDAPRTTPWMLWGAKTLSYAMNKATYRECARRDADTAIFYSTEGLMLECPTSSLVFRIGDRFYTPEPSLGILYGTSQREFFAYARAQGFSCEYGRYPIEKLDEADAIWTMGGSNVHPVSTYEGKAIHCDTDFAAAVNTYAREHHEEVTKSSLAELAEHGIY